MPVTLILFLGAPRGLILLHPATFDVFTPRLSRIFYVVERIELLTRVDMVLDVHLRYCSPYTIQKWSALRK